MIQFNLLPDVKIEFIKAQKAKRTVIVVAALSLVVSLGLLAVMMSVTMFQKQHIENLSGDIKKYQRELENTEDLGKILTVQNQLNSLPELYAKRPATTRLFTYIQATTPTQVSITELNIDFDENVLSVQGTSETLESVNRYVDTLKFTNYTVVNEKGRKKPFTNVVLSTFSRDSKTAGFTVTFKFDAEIFDSAKEVALDVPKTITTRSETELPGSGVFDAEGAN